MGNLNKITAGIKLLTYICTTIYLIAGNSPDSFRILIPLTAALFFITYFKDIYLIKAAKSSIYITACFAAELLIIAGIGFFDISGISILYYLVLISSVLISYNLWYSIVFSLPYIISRFFAGPVRSAYPDTGSLIGGILLSFGIPTLFVIGMSYIVKIQVDEKTRLSRINKELEQAYEKLLEKASVTRQLSVEQERTRMAREIHDTLAHTLTNVIVQLEACKKLAGINDPRLPGELEKAQGLTRDGLNDVKRTIKALRPRALEGRSLSDSLLELVKDTMVNTDINIVLRSSLPEALKLKPAVEVTLFRAIQESITNSIRHGRAGEIRLGLSLLESVLSVDISDNGAGCPYIKKGYGLQGIEERVDELNGSAGFDSNPGTGFRTVIRIPCKEAVQ